MNLNKNELKWLPKETKITFTLVYLERISELMRKIEAMWERTEDREMLGEENNDT